MTTASNVWSAHPEVGQSLPTKAPTPMAGPGKGGGTGTATTSTTSAAISANDFLTLLVTEMKNQDPTSQTDPNAYINQLVQVNSLEQLIDINQNLTTVLGVSASSSTTSETTSGAIRSIHTPDALPSISGHALTHFANGNLSIPETNPAAQRVALALSGRGSGL